MKKVFYGWWILLATSIIHFWGAGTFFYSFTAFFNPIVDEFGWSYGATSFAASLRSIEGGIASPIVGFAADRYGARRLLILGSILTGLGFVCLSRIDTLQMYYILFVFLSIGFSMLVPVPGWTALANWFVRSRGTVLGIISAAIGIGGILIYGVNGLIGMFGWRQTMVIIGIGTWIIGIPCAMIVRDRPEPYGLAPYGGNLPEPGSNTQQTPEANAPYQEEYGVREALQTKTFWFLCVAVSLSSGAVHGLTVHIMPYLISENFDRNLASIIATTLVITSGLGRFGMGWLTKYIDPRHLLALCLLMQALGLAVLGTAHSLWQAFLFILLFGPGYGGVVTLRITLQAAYFGRKAFGSLQGLMMGIAVGGTMSFPYLTGLSYDVYGSYRATWFIMSLIIIAIIPLALMARAPRKPGTKADSS